MLVYRVADMFANSFTIVTRWSYKVHFLIHSKHCLGCCSSKLHFQMSFRNSIFGMYKTAEIWWKVFCIYDIDLHLANIVAEYKPAMLG